MIWNKKRNFSWGKEPNSCIWYWIKSLKSLKILSQFTFTSPWKQKVKFIPFTIIDSDWELLLIIMGESANSSKLEAVNILFELWFKEEKIW